MVPTQEGLEISEWFDHRQKATDEEMTTQYNEILRRFQHQVPGGQERPGGGGVAYNNLVSESPRRRTVVRRDGLLKESMDSSVLRGSQQIGSTKNVKVVLKKLSGSLADDHVGEDYRSRSYENIKDGDLNQYWQELNGAQKPGQGAPDAGGKRITTAPGTSRQLLK